MCLLAFSHRQHPHWRFVLAGNRDEFHARPTASLAHWDELTNIVGGRDLQSGGTWAAIDRKGRIAVVTNVRDPAIQRPSAPSRGALPVDFLRVQISPVQQMTSLMTTAADYAPFNLILADQQSCQFASNYPLPRHAEVSPGLHGLSNGDLDAPWPKTLRLTQQLESWVQGASSDITALWQALANETLADDDQLPDTSVGIERERMLSPAFIRHPVYGTRTSTIIVIDYQGKGWISERRFGAEGVFQGETTLRID